MTIEQIQAFIVLAEQLNYTKAAELIFTSQPNLSRMISGIEMELNMQLFVRDRRNMRLTPAGVVIYNTFHNIYQTYLAGVENARIMQKGISGKVNIGVLEGTEISDFMPDMIMYFREKYPHIYIAVYSYSFTELVQHLYDHSVDMAFTIEFNLESYPDILYDQLEITKDNVVVPQISKLYNRDSITLEDLENEDLIIISPEDLPIISEKVVNQFREKHISPKYHYAPNLHTAMLWVEAGIGSAFLFSRNSLNYSLKAKFFQVDSPWNTSFVLGWHQDNYNPCIPLISGYCKEIFAERADNLKCSGRNETTVIPGAET